MGSLRSAPAQGYPPDDLTGFPTTTPPPTLYRAHREQNNPWWFSSYDPASGTPAGRFDLPRPRGTCYLATAPLGAARERMGRHTSRTIHADPVLTATVVSSLGTADFGEVADLEHRDAPLYGVTRELSTTGSYHQSAAWAFALDRLSSGIRYPLRFGIPAHGYAFFGSGGGQHDDRDTDPTPVRLLEILAGAGYEIIELPEDLPTEQPPQ
ncbi:hypothetical protein [Georgenia yuyongxinii]